MENLTKALNALEDMTSQELEGEDLEISPSENGDMRFGCMVLHRSIELVRFWMNVLVSVVVVKVCLRSLIAFSPRE
jgi:hypothetical protein